METDLPRIHNQAYKQWKGKNRLQTCQICKQNECNDNDDHDEDYF